MAEVQRYCTLVTGKDEKIVGLMITGPAYNRDCFEADGGKVILVLPDDDEYHSTYNLMRNGEVVGTYTTWCGRHPCYHEDNADLVRLGSLARERLEEKGLDVLCTGDRTFAVPKEVLALVHKGENMVGLLELLNRFFKKQASFAELRKAVEAVS